MSSERLHCIPESTLNGTEHFDNSYPNVVCLDPHQRIALSFTAETGAISMLAALGVLGLISRNIHARQPRLLRPADIYVSSLFAAEFFQGLGALLDAKWANEGRVYSGGMCTAQGVISAIGEPAVAITTLVIAVDTFVTIWWGKLHRSSIMAGLVVAVIWVYVILFSGIPLAVHGKQRHYYVPTPFWCWVDTSFAPESLVVLYVWVWLACLFSIILYTALFFLIRGNVTVDKGTWWRFQIHQRRDCPQSKKLLRDCYSLIAYPIVYIFIVGPVISARWYSFAHNHHDPRIRTAAMFVVANIFYLSGLLNALLFLLTKRGLWVVGTGEQH